MNEQHFTLPMRNADARNIILAEAFTKHAHNQQCNL